MDNNKIYESDYTIDCCDFCEPVDKTRIGLIEEENGGIKTTLQIIGSDLCLNIDVIPDDTPEGFASPWKFYKANINFCPYCGRALNPKKAKDWRITHAQTPVFTLVDKAIWDASMRTNLALWAKSHLMDLIDKEGFTTSEAEEALKRMIDDGILETIVVDDITYLVPIA